jgi:hypothetical protein
LPIIFLGENDFKKWENFILKDILILNLLEKQL